MVRQVALAGFLMAFVIGCVAMKDTHSYDHNAPGWKEVTWENSDGGRCAKIYWSSNDGYWTGYAYNDNSTQHHFDDEKSAREWVALWCKP